MNDFTPHDFTLNTEDGTAISATLFKPNEHVKAGVIINSATAVGRHYYRNFAQYLRQQGIAVITYDYRGIGGSNVKPVRHKSLTMQAWGEQDFNAVIAWASAEYPHLDWHCIGHSVGGQIVGLAKLNSKLKSVYLVAAQSGYWRNWNGVSRFKNWLVWYALVPLLSRLFGFFPGVLIGGENLPERVARQWGRWCRNEHYICDEQGNAYRPYFSNFDKKMCFVQLADDHTFAPMKAVLQLHDFYVGATRSIVQFTPQHFGQKSIGHFGFFKKHNEQGLWQHALRWIEGCA